MAQTEKDMALELLKDDPEFVIGWNAALEYSAKWIEEAGDDKHITVSEFAELNAVSLRAAKREIKRQGSNLENALAMLKSAQNQVVSMEDNGAYPAADLGWLEEDIARCKQFTKKLIDANENTHKEK